MSNSRRVKQGQGNGKKLTRTSRPAGRLIGRTRAEELGPEQRVELARRIEAKKFRGKPPSIYGIDNDPVYRPCILPKLLREVLG